MTAEPPTIDDPERAKALAVRILTYRARSRRELIDKLTTKGVEPALAEATADRCAQLRLIDDRALAESLTQSTLADRPAGRAYIAARLRRRGIPDDLARETIDQALSERDAHADALRVARARAKTVPPGLAPAAATRRLVGALARRGFDPDTTRRAVETVLAEADAGGPSDNPDTLNT